MGKVHNGKLMFVYRLLLFPIFCKAEHKHESMYCIAYCTANIQVMHPILYKEKHINGDYVSVCSMQSHYSLNDCFSPPYIMIIINFKS